ncbi:transposase for insertion sequence element IS1557 [Nocardioides szechwanensis]|nr:ISL3 family transposase [Nocardioides szechwanensis]GEP36332.1 transposase for insertion sequence element IS1557 [Nocardioides szechwanensis]
MSALTLWRPLLGLEDTAIEDVRVEPGHGGRVVVSVRPMARQKNRCGRCRRRSRRYDQGRGRRLWRTLDHGTKPAFLEADAPRVKCPVHGVVVAHVPWAHHGSGHTHEFDQQVAWLTVRTSKSAVTELMRVAWRTVGAIVARVWADLDTGDRLEGLRRIGIDEISYKRGYKFLTVVVDHDTGHLVWAGEGRTKAVLRRFFDDLGPDRAAQLTHVSADGADYIAEVVAQRCPNAVVCADPFHVVQWANDALTKVRLESWRAARKLARRDPPARSGPARKAQWLPGRDTANALKGARFALWKNPENLTEKQHAKLAWVAIADPRLHTAYLFKERLRLVFKMRPEDAADYLDEWIDQASHSDIAPMAELAERITRHRTRILAAIEHDMSNGPVESVNTKIRLLTRIAFGYKNPEALIALAMLALGPHRPALPGRPS